MGVKFRQALGPLGGRSASLDNQQRVFDRLTKADIFDGVQLSNVTLTTGQDNLVSHRLGRVAQGFITTGKTAQSDIWNSSTTNTSSTTQLILKCSANVIASFWVY